MFSTTETRWFFRGTIPPVVKEWFDQDDTAPPVAVTRTDQYLCVSGNEEIGIKLREGLLEVKQREQTIGPVRLHPNVFGMADAWRKWSFPLDGGQTDLSRFLVPEGKWIPVTKSRLLRRYRVLDDRSMEPCPINELPDLGCDWELTVVSVNDEPWWTVAFEAYGEEPRQGEALLLVTRTLLALAQPPELQALDSFAYPRWLMKAIA